LVSNIKHAPVFAILTLIPHKGIKVLPFLTDSRPKAMGIVIGKTN